MMIQRCCLSDLLEKSDAFYLHDLSKHGSPRFSICSETSFEEHGSFGKQKWLTKLTKNMSICFVDVWSIRED